MKKISILFFLVLLSASCNFTGQHLSDGVIKSTDGGVDWQFYNTPQNGGSALSSLSISRLAFSPIDRQTIFAGTYTDGLFESTDAAAHWTKILSNIDVYDFAINPQNPKIIYAAGFFADHGRVLKTADGGNSWVQIYNEEHISNPVRAIALNPANPNEIIIGTALGTVIKSSDGGSTWQLVKDFKDQVNRIIWQGGNIYILLKTRGLFISSDDGQTFQDITSSLHKTYNGQNLVYTQGRSITSFSQFYVDTLSRNLIYMTTSNGVYKTTDGGTTWQLLNLPVKLGDTAHAVTLAPGNSSVVFASIDNTIYKTLDGGATWQTQVVNSGGFVNFLLTDPQIPQIVYGGIYATQ